MDAAEFDEKGERIIQCRVVGFEETGARAETAEGVELFVPEWEFDVNPPVIGSTIEIVEIIPKRAEASAVGSIRRARYWLTSSDADSSDDGRSLTATVAGVLSDRLLMRFPDGRSATVFQQPSDRQRSIGDSVSVVSVGRSRWSNTEELRILEDQDAIISKYPVGRKFTAKVTKLIQSGAFASNGEITGFIMKADINKLKMVRNSELSEGEELDLTVDRVDTVNRRLRFNISEVVGVDARAGAFNRFSANHHVGEICDGSIKNVVQFGVFVEIDGFDCLAHVSTLNQIDVRRLQKFDPFRVRILSFDQMNRRVAVEPVTGELEP